nr:glutaredoxin family protein [Undibacterium oligocarboniphilum]
MLEQLRHSLTNPEQFAISVVDVDTDPLLLAQYDELVPVLIGQKNVGPVQKICHYFLDKQALDAFLKA